MNRRDFLTVGGGCVGVLAGCMGLGGSSNRNIDGEIVNNVDPLKVSDVSSAIEQTAVRENTFVVRGMLENTSDARISVNVVAEFAAEDGVNLGSFGQFATSGAYDPIPPKTRVEFVVGYTDGPADEVARYNLIIGPNYSPTTKPTTTVAQTDGKGDGSSSTASEQTASPVSLSPVFHHTLDGDFSDAATSIEGRPAASGVEFVPDRGGTVLKLAGNGAGDTSGFYDVLYSDMTEYVSVGDPLTTALWVKPTNNTGWEQIVNGAGSTIDIRDNTIRFRWYNPSTGQQEFLIEMNVGVYAPNNQWTHIAGTITPGQEARLFIDGAQVGATAVGPDQGFRIANSASLRVGFHRNADTGLSDSHFNGRIDDVRFFKGAMDADQIEDLYKESK